MIQITALICTRNRPRQILEAVRSLLIGADGSMELIVLDQSPNGDTEAALSPLRNEPRVRYVRSPTIGKGVALNQGLELANGSILVLTDDDCVAPPGWVRHMAQLFETRPRVAVVFCNVVPVEHDRQRGYVPCYERTHDRLITSLWELRSGLGLGAGMAIRSDVVRGLGGFDEAFGPGGRFPSADDWDIAVRALIGGWHVYESAELSITHDGYRSFQQGREHALRDWIALGAASAKPLRAGHWPAASVPLLFYPTRALWPPCRDLLQLRRPRGLKRVTAYLQGFVEGMATPLDQRSLKFRGAP